MSNKPTLGFSMDFVGDGSSTQVTISTSAGPIQFNKASDTELSPLFNSLPTDAIGLACSQPAFTITKHSLSLGVLVLDIAGGPPNNGQVYTITGTLVY